MWHGEGILEDGERGYLRGQAGGRKLREESDIITIIFKNRKKAERILGEMLAESSHTKTCAT